MKKPWYVSKIVESSVDPQVLDEVQAKLQHELFGSPPVYVEHRADIDPQDERLTELLDLLMVLSLRNPDEVSFIWTRAAIQSVTGRYREAATDYLEAARRSSDLAGTGSGLNDEADWTEAAYYHAARNFVLAELCGSAAHIVGNIKGDLREEILKQLDAQVQGEI